MLAGDAERLRERRRADGPTSMRNNEAPGRLLKRRLELQRARWLVQRTGKPRRVAQMTHDVSSGAVVHAIHENVGELVARTLGERRAFRRSQRRHREEWSARILPRA